MNNLHEPNVTSGTCIQREPESAICTHAQSTLTWECGIGHLHTYNTAWSVALGTCPQSSWEKHRAHAHILQYNTAESGIWHMQTASTAHEHALPTWDSGTGWLAHIQHTAECVGTCTQAGIPLQNITSVFLGKKNTQVQTNWYNLNSLTHSNISKRTNGIARTTDDEGHGDEEFNLQDYLSAMDMEWCGILKKFEKHQIHN